MLKLTVQFALLLVLFVSSAFANLTPKEPSYTEHSVLLLHNNIESTQARIDLILKAERTIKAQYFIFGNDNAGLAGLALIRDQVLQKGVKAQILVDAFFNSIPKEVQSYLVSVGVELKVYHPFRITRLDWLTRRMHDKGLSIDAKEMIRGGRNAEGAYFGYGKKRNYIDRDVYVKGEEVIDSDEYFDELFASGEVAPVKISTKPEDIAKGKVMLDDALAAAKRIGVLRFNNPQDLSQHPATHKVDNLWFIHDPVGKKGKEVGIGTNILNLILEAKNKVLIESPYLVPTPEFLDLIRALKARNPNIEITILTNSVASTDGAAPQGGYLRYRQTLLDLGIRLFEYKGPEALHAKCMVIDDHIAGVSSYNLDPRSQFLNTEIGIVTRDAGVANELTESIISRMEHSWEMGPNGKPLDGSNQREGLSFKQRAIFAAAYCASFLEPIKNQL